jgi:hypothetical protein
MSEKVFTKIENPVERKFAPDVPLKMLLNTGKTCLEWI